VYSTVATITIVCRQLSNHTETATGGTEMLNFLSISISVLCILEDCLDSVEAFGFGDTA
jgi:hypothetical protein